MTWMSPYTTYTFQSQSLCGPTSHHSKCWEAGKSSSGWTYQPALLATTQGLSRWRHCRSGGIPRSCHHSTAISSLGLRRQTLGWGLLRNQRLTTFGTIVHCSRLDLKLRRRTTGDSVTDVHIWIILLGLCQEMLQLEELLLIQRHSKR